MISTIRTTFRQLIGTQAESTIIQEESKKKADIEKINEELNDYAKNNPIEFQLITSYDENFALLDKYIQEEKTKYENNNDYVGDYVSNAIERIYNEAKVQSSTLNQTSILYRMFNIEHNIYL